MIAGLSIGTKLIIWLCIVLLLPMVTVVFVRRVLDEESNAATFLLLAGYTALDTLAAWILIGAVNIGIWPALILIGGAVLAGVYNYTAFAAIRKYGG